MPELLYATSHLAGSLTNPDNALGNTPSTWAGVVNANTSATSRYAIGDPADPLTPSATQTVNVRTRKGSNSNNPSVTVNLYENGGLIGELVASTTITSTTGQTLTGTFNSSQITNPADVEVEVVVSGVGGSGSARNSAQIAFLEWSAETTASAPSGGTVSTVNVASSGAGSKRGEGASQSEALVSAEGAGSKHSESGSTARVGVAASGGGRSGGGAKTGGSEAALTVAGSGSGMKTTTGGAFTGGQVTAEGAGSKRVSRGTFALVETATTGGGYKQAENGDQANVQVSAFGDGHNPDGPPSGGSTAQVTVNGEGSATTIRYGGTTAGLSVIPFVEGLKEAYGGTTALVTVAGLGGGDNPSGPRLVSPAWQIRLALEAPWLFDEYHV